jgi:hypothetical protein
MLQLFEAMINDRPYDAKAKRRPSMETSALFSYLSGVFEQIERREVDKSIGEGRDFVAYGLRAVSL